MNGMFRGCCSLKQSFGNWVVHPIRLDFLFGLPKENMHQMFAGCVKMSIADLPGWIETLRSHGRDLPSFLSDTNYANIIGILSTGENNEEEEDTDNTNL